MELRGEDNKECACGEPEGDDGDSSWAWEYDVDGADDGVAMTVPLRPRVRGVEIGSEGEDSAAAVDGRAFLEFAVVL